MLGAKVLLVEDEPIVAHHLQSQLTSLGYDVAAVASDGVEALGLIEEKRPALVLMDIGIEGELDGIETASRIPAEYHIPVIYLTAFSEEATLERARATRPYGFLLKPFADQELHATIQMALERRQTELALRASEERLRQAQKMEVIGQLAGGVAHDFNNLLAIISGNLELVREAIGNRPDIVEMLQDAQDAAVRGASLTQQLLAYSRRQPLAPEVLDMGALVAGMRELLARTLGETIRIRTSTAPGLWRARADRRQLENAILNLAVNARDAMPDGGWLTIEASNVELDADYAAEQDEVTPGPYVTLGVSDTGIGMPPEVAARALEPFFTTKPVGHGTGLGLSMVYGFVKQSQGHIKIYSERGRGTTVRIYLPAADGTEGEAAQAQDGSGLPVARAGETVLVVEDDPMVRKLAVRLLTGLGYGVIEAESGPMALALAGSAERIDLLLTDLVLPEGMNGATLARRIGAVRPGLRALFMSGYAADAVSGTGLIEAGVPLLSKPFRKLELAVKLREALDGAAPS
jgi:signal transduction histidine kinase